MGILRLGQVGYLNCLPVYHALEEGLLPLQARLIKGPPTRLNQMFLNGELDITPISSIEYARHSDRCMILPNLSISADGGGAGVLFFSRSPVTEMEGKRVCVTSGSATAVVLLKILFEHYYQVEVDFCSSDPDFESMLEMGDGVLLVGDDALQAYQRVQSTKWPLYVTDLGEAWKKFTGEKMVYAIWVISREFVEKYPEETNHICAVLQNAKEIGLANITALIKKGRRRTSLPEDVLEKHFKTIVYELGEDEKRALLTFYDYAYKSGFIEERVRLRIWGEGE